MDAYLAVVAKREVREYTDRPVPEDVLTKVLEAGRAAGSAKNTQPWRFIVLKDRQHRHDLSSAMMAPRNLDRCAVAIAVVLLNERQRFDAGRVAQNMMVTAWALGVGSCPNSVRPDEHDRMRQDLRVPADARADAGDSGPAGGPRPVCPGADRHRQDRRVRDPHPRKGRCGVEEAAGSRRGPDARARTPGDTGIRRDREVPQIARGRDLRRRSLRSAGARSRARYADRRRYAGPPARPHREGKSRSFGSLRGGARRGRPPP